MPVAGQKGNFFADYLDLLDALHRQGVEAQIVDGHAVNFWAEQFQEEEEEIQSFRPFISEDLDLHQPSLLAYEFLRGQARHTERERDQFGKAWTIVGQTFYIDSKDGTTLAIDSLKMVAGLRPREVRKGIITAEFKGVPIHVLNPVILLKAKTYNVLHIDQRDRQDEKHVRILVPCLRAFIRRLLKEALSTGKMRPLLNALELVIQTTSHREVVSAANKLGLDLKQALPLLEIEKCRIPQVVNFVTHRLPHWRWFAKAKPPDKANQG